MAIIGAMDTVNVDVMIQTRCDYTRVFKYESNTLLTDFFLSFLLSFFPSFLLSFFLSFFLSSFFFLLSSFSLE